jgi:hypothetical protein
MQMLGRVAVAISLLFFPILVFPQCNLSQVASIPFRATYLDVAVEGNDLWSTTSYGLSLYDRSVDPPALVASLALPGITRVVRVANGIAYTGSGAALIVVRKSGRSLQIVRSVDIGATINDLLLTTNFLYVAAANGLTQRDLLDLTTPRAFATSRSNVLSLALNANESTLFAAEGNSTIDTFNISVPSIPNGLGTIASLPGSIAVNTAGGRLYVSDGSQTDVFTNIDGGGGTAVKAGTDAFGAVAVAPINTTAIFAGGADRQVRALDMSSAAAPVELSRAQLLPSGGNVNRIGRIATAPNRLYVAGGDLGLLTYDTTSFATPFPVRSYGTGATSSVVSFGDKLYVSRATAGLTEFTQAANGALTQARSWDSAKDTVWDGGSGFLLTSSGATASLWALNPSIPTLVSSVTLRAPIVSAVLIGTTGSFVLSEATGNTLWSADMGPVIPVAQQIVLSGTKPSFIARSGTALVLAELRADDGKTALSYYASPDFSKAPVTVLVVGLATGGVALSGGVAATSTFNGVGLTDFASGATTLLPQSSNAIARSLAFAGTTLLEATSTALITWNTQTRTLSKQFALPAAPVAVHVAPDGNVADLATEEGVTSLQLGASTRLPSLLFALNGNAYYKKLVTGSQRLYLFDGRNVDIFTNTLQSTGSIRTPLILDVAASDSGVFTIQNNLTVMSYGREGNTLATSVINEGTDTQVQSVAAVGGPAWASVIVHCQSTGCEGKTIVFDPKSAFAQTATMTGAVRDVVTSGTRAYVLTELPNEIRVVDISDPAHPSVIVSHASEGTQPPRAIAFANGTVYVLGENLYTYSATDLTKASDALGAYVTDPTSGVTYVDQHIRADGSCLALTGRQFSPRFLTGTPPIASPAAGRFIATQPGTFYFLTDYSIEIWSTKAIALPPRRHAAR